MQRPSKGMRFWVHGAPIVATPTALIGFRGQIFGHQHDTPLFGPPHGHGIAQLEKTKPTDDRVWSFLENIRFAVELTMGEKAHEAFTARRPPGGEPTRARSLSAGCGASLQRRDRVPLEREPFRDPPGSRADAG